MSRLPVYVAHQLSHPTRDGILANLAQGALWCAWLAEHFEIAPVAPWIYLASVLEETPENRAMGLECDIATLAVCSELWLLGPRISSGMLLEAQEAYARGKPVRDLTGFDAITRIEAPSEDFIRRATEFRWRP
jgi:hypothetical protein